MKRLLEFFRLINQPCRDMTGLLSRSMDRQLPFHHRLAYRIHLLYCTACRRYLKQLKGLRAAIRHVVDELADPAAEPSPGPNLSKRARSRISKAIRNR
jgi:hypothetical protein